MQKGSHAGFKRIDRGKSRNTTYLRELIGQTRKSRRSDHSSGF